MIFEYPKIICSYSVFEKLKNSFEKREVLPDRNCPNDEWFYWNRKGEMRTVFSDGSIWKSEYAWCDLLNMKAPTGMIIKIRKEKMNRE